MRIKIAVFSLLLAAVCGRAAEDIQPLKTAWQSRWKAPAGTLAFSESVPETLTLNNSSDQRISARIVLPELVKGQLYLLRGEVMSSAPWRAYCESGAGKIWEAFGVTKPAAATEQWKNIEFTFRYKKRPSEPYLFIGLHGAGTLKARGISIAPIPDGAAILNEKLASGEPIDLAAPEYRRLFRLLPHESGAVGWNAQANSWELSNESSAVTRIKLPDLMFQAGDSYSFAVEACADRGVQYRVFLENCTNGNYRNAIVAMIGDGTWQPITQAFCWPNIETPSYLMLELKSSGKVQFRNLQLRRIKPGMIPNLDLSQGVSGWRTGPGATIRTGESDGVSRTLELKTTDAGRPVEAESSPGILAPGKTYRLEYQVVGIPGGGDATNSHFYSIQLVDARNRPIVGEGSENMVMDNLGKMQKNVVFEIPGKGGGMKLKFQLKAPGHVQFSNMTLSEVVQHQAAGQILLDPPFNYRSGIFNGTGETKITGKIKLSAPDAARGVLSLIEPGNPPRAICESTPSREQAFAVAPPKIGGRQELVLDVYDATGRRLDSLSQTIYNYPARRNTVAFAADGTTLIDGKPFLQLGHWAFMNRGDHDAEMAFLSEAKINTLAVRKAPNSLFDLARKHNMKLIVMLPERIEGKTAAAKKLAAEALADQVRYWSERPELLGYFGPDEPFLRGVPLREIAEVFQIVRTADPYHPIWINEAPRGEIPGLRPYADLADVYGVDIYPVPEGNSHSALADKGLTAVGKYTRLARETVGARKPIWMILQSFSWSHVKEPSLSKTKAIFPTGAQSRFMAYDALVNGATGLQWHYLGYSQEIPDDFWAGLRQTTLELSYLTPILVTASIKPAVLTSTAPEIVIMQKKLQDQDYFFILNTSPQPVTAEFSGVADTPLNVLREPESPIQPVNGRFSLTMPGRGVTVASAVRFPRPEILFKADSYQPYSRPLSDGPALRKLKTAHWIWLRDQYRQAGSKIELKREFQLPGAVRVAWLRIYADDRYKALSINGKTVDAEPAGNCNEYDISRHLKPGANEIRLQAMDGGVPPCGFLALLDIELKDGTHLNLTSDRQWQCMEKGGVVWTPAEEICRFGELPWNTQNPLLFFLEK